MIPSSTKWKVISDKITSPQRTSLWIRIFYKPTQRRPKPQSTAIITKGNHTNRITHKNQPEYKNHYGKKSSTIIDSCGVCQDEPKIKTQKLICQPSPKSKKGETKTQGHSILHVLYGVKSSRKVCILEFFWWIKKRKGLTLVR